MIVIQAGTNNIGAQPGGGRQGRRDHARTDRDSRRLPAAGAARDDHPDRDLSSQRQHGGDAGDRSGQREPGAPGQRPHVRYLNVNDRLADKDGRLFAGMMNERDKLHPTLQGYQVWADGLKPIFTELLGPPAATDHAPPPTGDPSATP